MLPWTEHRWSIHDHRICCLCVLSCDFVSIIHMLHDHTSQLVPAEERLRGLPLWCWFRPLVIVRDMPPADGVMDANVRLGMKGCDTLLGPVCGPVWVGTRYLDALCVGPFSACFHMPFSSTCFSLLHVLLSPPRAPLLHVLLSSTTLHTTSLDSRAETSKLTPYRVLHPRSQSVIASG